jgi:hypothetical protein
MPNDVALVRSDYKRKMTGHHRTIISLKIEEVLKCTPETRQCMNRSYLKNEYTHE